MQPISPLLRCTLFSRCLIINKANMKASQHERNKESTQTSKSDRSTDSKHACKQAHTQTSTDLQLCLSSFKLFRRVWSSKQTRKQAAERRQARMQASRPVRANKQKLEKNIRFENVRINIQLKHTKTNTNYNLKEETHIKQKATTTVKKKR